MIASRAIGSSSAALWAVRQVLFRSPFHFVPVTQRLCLHRSTFIVPCLGLPGLSRGLLSHAALADSLEIEEGVTATYHEAQSSQVDASTIIKPDGPVRLRPYQQSAIDKCLQALSSGLNRLGVSSPTGSGKTTMFMNLIPQVPIASTRKDEKPDIEQEKGRTLILVGSVELANQAERAARRLLPGWSVEVEQSKRTASGRADITIATYQTLNNVERLRKLDPSRFKLVIVDEAHHAAAFSYLRLLHYFNDEIQLPSSISPITQRNHGTKVPIIGFSATFSRNDQLALGAVFQEIVFHREITSMLEEGWLSPARSTRLECDLDLDNVEENDRGDFRTSSLADRVNVPEINQLIVRTYLHRAGDRRSTLVFCVDLNHVAELTQAFRMAGIDARSVSSQSDPRIRRETISQFGKGEFRVLINCEVLTEGTDIPEIDCIILARPTKSKNLLAQMVGRGLRLSPDTGKVDCFIIDMVDTMSRANGLLVSPTLWGLTHDDMENDKIVRERVEAKDQSIEPELSSKAKQGPAAKDFNVTFYDQDDPFGLGVDSKPIVARVSPNAWVACGNGRYVLELFAVGDISLEPSSDDSLNYAINFRQRLPPELSTSYNSPYRRSRVIAMAEDLERAFQTGDKFAERRVGRDLAKQLSRYAPWRRRPASEKQLKLLIKMKGVDTMSEDLSHVTREVRIFGKKVDLDKITAGQVAAYLCAANHGAATLRSKMDKVEQRQLAKIERKRQKEIALKERNLPLPTE